MPSNFNVKHPKLLIFQHERQHHFLSRTTHFADTMLTC